MEPACFRGLGKSFAACEQFRPLQCNSRGRRLSRRVHPSTAVVLGSEAVLAVHEPLPHNQENPELGRDRNRGGLGWV